MPDLAQIVTNTSATTLAAIAGLPWPILVLLGLIALLATVVPQDSHDRLELWKMLVERGHSGEPPQPPRTTNLTSPPRRARAREPANGPTRRWFRTRRRGKPRPPRRQDPHP